MSVLIVYESLFGNTKLVAEEVAAALAPLGATLVRVDEAPTALGEDVDLLVVGGPTHAFGMTRPSTRADAVTKYHAANAGTLGIREWLERLAPARPDVQAVAFDTRVRRPRLPGSAANGAAKRLRSLGYAHAVDPQSFWVDGAEGPLHAGERERARSWGAGLADRARTA